MSIFYDSRYVHRFPVPLLAFERFAELSKACIDGTDSDWLSLYLQVLSECCEVHNKPNEEDILYFQKRLLESSVKEEEEQAKNLQTFKGITMGHALDTLLDSLSTADLLLMVADYNLEKAEYLYCKIDRNIALHAIRIWIKELSHRHNMNWEAVMYAQGGRYKNDKSDQEFIDLRDGSVNIDELNKLFAH